MKVEIPFNDGKVHGIVTVEYPKGMSVEDLCDYLKKEGKIDITPEVLKKYYDKKEGLI